MSDNLTCGLVRDLLPSYLEGLTGEETNEAVERHLSSCPRCTAALEEMRQGARAGTRAAEREVEYLKKVRRSGKNRVLLAVLSTAAALLAVFLLKIFVIGTPLQAQTLAVAAARIEDYDRLYLRLISTSSGNAYHSWRVETVDGVASVYARSVPVSALYHSGEGEVYVPLEGVREVWLGGRSGRLVWQDGMVISQLAADLMELKTPYCGDPTALGNIARVLGIQEQIGSYTVSMVTSKPPYRWTLAFDWNLNDARQSSMKRYACVMLALVENLDEVAWTWPDGAGLLFRDTAGRHLRELTETHNLGPSGGSVWYPKDSVKDYAQSAAELQRMLVLLGA